MISNRFLASTMVLLFATVVGTLAVQALTPEEELGKSLFFDKISNPDSTDFTYDNLGVPKNPENPFYDMDEVFLDDGTPIYVMQAGAFREARKMVILK